jgi:excisionase family DNA binding protein
MSEYVSVPEAARLLDCSTTHVRNQAASGDLEAEKVKGKWRIRRDAVETHPRPHRDTTPQHHNATTATQQHNGDTTAPPPQHHATTAQENNTTTPPQHHNEWRDDLLAQVARLEADKVDAMRADFDTRLAEQRQESGLLIEASKARVIDLERELTMRDSRFADMQSERDTEVSDLRGQIAVLEAKVRSTLEERAEENGQLANRIADLVAAHTEVQSRVYELEPVADQVPMLQAAVDEKDAALTEREQTLSDRERELGKIHADIDAIAGKRVTGPVFRLLVKGRLRR